ncbi:hypothetical protein SG34_001350 [Thalassomonas viridans]|uniref:Uncharacterized protein n=1 Tax=Thalassomonas viridans TaxID=137584 RepID=A0AAE9Z5H3_9GAMM|nr:hypothetical protein [Thalassomonas viridans]WDE05618.1 hypothetical protein SG34_001350 [Thalassomonas viridans]
MAKVNDMPEFHSVKVFVTENTPHHRHSSINAGILLSQGFTGRNLLLTSAGGQAHV